MSALIGGKFILKNGVISTNESTRIITGHVIYLPADTYKFQLKTTKEVDHFLLIGKLIDQMDDGKSFCISIRTIIYKKKVLQISNCHYVDIVQIQ